MPTDNHRGTGGAGVVGYYDRYLQVIYCKECVVGNAGNTDIPISETLDEIYMDNTLEFPLCHFCGGDINKIDPPDDDGYIDDKVPLFAVYPEDVQSFARDNFKLISDDGFPRRLTDDEMYMVEKGIQSGLSFGLDTVLRAAIEAAIENP
jgi:hypothetical protein